MRSFLPVLSAAVTLTACSGLPSQPARTVAQIVSADQLDRSGDRDKIDWSAVSARDTARRAEIFAILNAGGVRTAQDYHDAALVFQHGETADELRLANALAVIASRLQPNDANLKWLVAASWDRWLMRSGKPQWYGTQFVRESPAGPWALYPVDESAVTDAQREEMGVPSIANSKAHVSTLNK